MATIKDIAKVAGVAQGTVSNVLNNRGNVSSDKIRRVLSACDQLGYVPNDQAKRLRQSHSRLIGVILPNLRDKRTIDFYISFKTCVENHGYSVRQYLSSELDGQQSEEAIQQEVLRDGVGAMAVFAGSQPMMSVPFNGETSVIYVEHRPSFAADFIGFNYREAGARVAEAVRENGCARIVLLTGSLWASSTAEFCAGFRENMRNTAAEITHIQTDKQSEQQSILQSRELTCADAVVCSRMELAQVARNLLRSFGGSTLPRIYTLSPLFTLPEIDFSKYELNYRLLGNATAKKLIRRIETKKPLGEQLLPNNGFRSFTPPPTPHAAQQAINVITLDSPEAYTLQYIAKLYTHQTGVPVHIAIYSYDEIFDIFNSGMRGHEDCDVLRIDVTMLSFFARRLLTPLTDIDPGIANFLSTFLKGTVDPYAYVNNTLYALPFSPSTQMLYYRRDLFSNAMVGRMFVERFGRELTVPVTFEEYNEVASFFTQSLNPDSPVRYGTTLTVGSIAVASSEYLQRLFALQENLYDENGRVDMRAPNFVCALRQLLAARPYADPNYSPWWRKTVSAFAGGDIAMALLYNNFASPLVSYQSKVRDSIGCALIPGGRPVIGGGCLGVSKRSAHPELALNFIRWLCSEPIASASAFLGGVSPCAESYNNYEIINAYPWLKNVNRSFAAARGRRVPPHVETPFDERAFLNIVGASVLAACRGELSPEQAMALAHKRFQDAFGFIFARL